VLFSAKVFNGTCAASSISFNATSEVANCKAEPVSLSLPRAANSSFTALCRIANP